MSASRDRLERPLDIEALFARRTGPPGILRDDVVGLPLHRWSNGRAFGVFAPRRGGGVAGTRTPRVAMGRGLSAFRTPAPRDENTPPRGTFARGRGHGRNRLLPSWYPRTPLRDITATVRAIERRRGTIRDGEGRGIADLLPEGERLPDDIRPGSGAPLEPMSALATPSAVRKNSTFSAEKVSETLRKFSTVSADDPEFLTPQKKLLDSIEIVEKIVMEDLERLQRTPSAKRAEREKKIRTLMSMR